MRDMIPRTWTVPGCLEARSHRVQCHGGQETGELSLAAADAGHIFFRSSWEEDSHFTYMKCGPLGSGHGHADLTHISLHYRGCPILVDSGRYSYVEEEPLRPFLKSARPTMYVS